MEIKSYTRTQLDAFIQAEEFVLLANIPISKHRAISQIKNPFASEDDILLWAAYENSILVGYVGVLPDELLLSGITSKIYWLSCFWVKESYRDTTVASQLFLLLLRNYRRELHVSNFLFSLEQMYQRLGVFQPTRYLYGKVFFRKSDISTFIAKRHPALSFVSLLLNAFELVLNSFLTLITVPVEDNEVSVAIKYSMDFDDELSYFLSKFSAECLVRNVDYFKWVCVYPWVLQEKPDSESQRYFFSAKAIKFEYHPVKLYDGVKLCGFALIKIRDKQISATHLYIDDKYITALGNYICKLMQLHNLTSFKCLDARLINYMDNYKGFIYKKKLKRPYLLPKNSILDVSVFQEGDGDSVFT